MKKLLIVTLLALPFISCSQPPLIKEVKVPTPCEVEYIPREPKSIDIEHSSLGVIMAYIKDIVSYAKEVQPIIDNCVVVKKNKETK